MFQLETNRMILRKMKLSDVGKLSRIFTDPIAMQFYPSTKNEEETVAWIKWNQGNYEKYGIGFWIAENKQDGEFIGQCGLVPQEINLQQEIEIGYLIVRKYWGQGLATECAIACREYGFHKLGHDRLISLIDKRNVASRRVAENVGMTWKKEISKWNKTIQLYSITK